MTSTADGWMGGQTDGQTDGRTDGRAEILPCILQHIVPSGAAAQKQKYRLALEVHEQPTLVSRFRSDYLSLVIQKNLARSNSARSKIALDRLF